MNRKTILMSPADSNILNYFRKRFNVLSSDYIDDLITFERYHADMQAIKIQDKLYINSKSKNLIDTLAKMNRDFEICTITGCKYPDNVALNAVYIGNKILCKKSSLHPQIKVFCERKGINIINVNQGYTKCSTLIIDDNSIVTDDESIATKAMKSGIEVLKIEKGDIYLDHNNYGFIGGASVRIGNSVYFFGDINTHRNASEIKTFIKKHNLNIVCTGAYQLIDIGGVVVLD